MSKTFLIISSFILITASDAHFGHALSIVIDNQTTGRVESLRLVNKHVAACVIRIICNAETTWNFAVTGVHVKRFNNLGRF